MISTVRKALALYQVRALEISLQGKIDTLPYIRDEATRAAMGVSIRDLHAELARARSHYSSFLPVGERIVWRTA